MPAHLHAVTPLDPDAQLPLADTLTGVASRLARDAETFTGNLRAAGGDLDGHAILGLRTYLTAAADALTEAKRLVDKLGNDWCAEHGRRGRVEIDGELYRASWSGSSSSLKVGDKARLADTFFRERLAPWLAETLGEDDSDGASTARLWLSLVAEKLGEVFTLDPKAAALAERWQLDASAFASPTSGGGTRPSFEKVPTPPTKKESA